MEVFHVGSLAKESQRIKVGDSIVVTVVRLSGDKVRLGIEALRDMVVLREELDLGSSPIAGGQRSPCGAKQPRPWRRLSRASFCGAGVSLPGSKQAETPAHASGYAGRSSDFRSTHQL